MLYIEPKELKLQNDKDFLALLYEKCPEIKTMELLIKGFKNLFVNKEEGTLSKCIQEATKPVSALKGFARNLNNDYEAVNGQLEGQINRIKNIKRRMYGRASFQLLRTMILAKSG